MSFVIAVPRSAANLEEARVVVHSTMQANFARQRRCEDAMPAKRSNSVIDISHHNGTKLRFDKAKADGIIGVIQKATQGESYVDRTFGRNREAILAAGLLFGAYHFGDGSDGTLQAKHFLNVVQPDANTVI